MLSVRLAILASSAVLFRFPGQRFAGLGARRDGEKNWGNSGKRTWDINSVLSTGWSLAQVRKSAYRGRPGRNVLGHGAITTRTDKERFLKPNSERNDDGFGFSNGFWNGFWNRKRSRLRFGKRLRFRLRLRSKARFRRGRACRRRLRHSPAHVPTYTEAYFEGHDLRTNDEVESGNDEVEIRPSWNGRFAETPNPKPQVPRPIPGIGRRFIRSRVPAVVLSEPVLGQGRPGASVLGA